MATSRLTLQPFNNLSIAVGTQYNLVPPTSGRYYVTILNVSASGNVAISNASTVAPTDPASYLLPPNLSLSWVVSLPTGVWLAAGATATVSVTMAPRGE